MVIAGSMSRRRLDRPARRSSPWMVGAWLVGTTLALAACRKDEPDPEAVRRGREVWLTGTFGGERFFSELLPRPPFGLTLGFDVLLTTDRDRRFDESLPRGGGERGAHVRVDAVAGGRARADGAPQDAMRRRCRAKRPKRLDLDRPGCDGTKGSVSNSVQRGRPVADEGAAPRGAPPPCRRASTRAWSS